VNDADFIVAICDKICLIFLVVKSKINRKSNILILRIVLLQPNKDTCRA